MILTFSVLQQHPGVALPSHAGVVVLVGHVGGHPGRVGGLGLLDGGLGALEGLGEGEGAVGGGGAGRAGTALRGKRNFEDAVAKNICTVFDAETTIGPICMLKDLKGF